VDAPKEKVTLDSLGDDVADVLRNQDLSLALAISGDAANELSQDATSIQRVDDVKIDGQSYPALQVLYPRFDLTLAIEPQTHLVRRTVTDLSKNARLMGAQSIKTAVLTTDFVHSPSASAEAGQFAWSPPPGAQPLVAADSEAGAPLEGKPIPDFTLNDLAGNAVSSQSLKGSVYVLDLWATWCGPCVASLPGLDAIYKDYRGKGVKFFAINAQEEKADVQKFVDDTKLSIPVLLDPDGKVNQALDTDNAIPFTLVVGKDGIVIKAGHMGGAEDELRSTIDAALKK
jgi:thiol-disulfide isomerase/thioredoxin